LQELFLFFPAFLYKKINHCYNVKAWPEKTGQFMNGVDKK